MKTLLLSLLFFVLFSSQNNLSAINVSVGASGATYITDGSNDDVEIQQAINFCTINGGGIVTIFDGTYNIQARLIPKNNVILQGTSTLGTVFSSIRTYDYMLFNSGTNVLYNFHVKNMTFNAINAQNASSIRLQYAHYCSITDVKFINVTCAGWHLVLGIDGNAAQNSNEVSRDCVIKNCTFDGHLGSLEMLLLFNTKNILIDNCTFKNKYKQAGCSSGNSPVVGLWQKTDSIYIQNCNWLDNNTSEGIYLSSTSHNTLINNCNFTNSGGIRGTNSSDWGDFGVPFARNLIVKSCTFQGGTYSQTLPGVQIGGMRNVLIKDTNIDSFEEGVLIDKGHSAIGGKSKHWAIIRCNITNSNPLNNVHNLHPGLFLQSFGGALNGFVICGSITDFKTPPYMYRPVSHYLNTPAAFDSIHVLGTNLVGYPGGEKLYFANGTTQGANYNQLDCANTPSYCTLCTNITDAQAINQIAQYDVVTSNIINTLNQFTAPVQILPLQLIDFKGVVREDEAHLYWTIASAKNVSHFEIEKSFDATSFSTLRQITLSKQENYDYTDITFSKNTYYRLKIIDFDGRYEYSKIIFLQNPDDVIRIFPNPTNDFLTIQINDYNQPFELINQLGQPILKGTQLPKTLKIDDLQTGVYFLRINNTLFQVLKN